MTAATRCKTLTTGQALRLESLGAAEHDRYGRVVAFAFTGDAQQSVQQVLLEQGRARVSARVGDKACADALLSAERAAREAHRGLWADPNFAPLSAENLSRLQTERGHFALVEGKVLSVRESGATIYMSTSGGAGRGISPSSFFSAWQSFHRRRGRTQKARGPPHSGARLDRAARRPDHHGRGARTDRSFRMNMG